MTEPRRPYRITITTHDADNDTAIISIERELSAWVLNQVIQALFLGEEHERRYYDWRADIAEQQARSSGDSQP